MAKLKAIDSNVTGLRYAEEESIGVLPGSPVWNQLEPNSYSEFGSTITTVAREPISDSRQRKKGVVTDLDASSGFNTDLTSTNIKSLMQGFFFSDIRRPGYISTFTEVDSVLQQFETSESTADFQEDDIVFATGFKNSQNNTWGYCNGVSATAINVAVNGGALVADASPNTGASPKLYKVGHMFQTGDISVDVSGDYPKLVSASSDFGKLDILPGEWLFVSGQDAFTKFVNEENNGFARVRSVSTSEIELDKTYKTMVSDNGSGKAIVLLQGEVLKNQLGSDIKRRTYQFERTLGAPDPDQPTQIQAEYSVGSVPNEVTFNLATADKISVDMSFVSLDSETVLSTESLKSGSRPSVEEADAFNTTSNIPLQRLTVIEDGVSNPTSLFAYTTDVSITINNNVSLNKAIGVLGGFEATAGNFEVDISAEAYFNDVAGIRAVRNNADVTYDIHLFAENQGISLDMPLLALGDGRPNVSKDESIKMPITGQGATGAKLGSHLDHTLLMVYWPYLPDAAGVTV